MGKIQSTSQLIHPPSISLSIHSLFFYDGLSLQWKTLVDTAFEMLLLWQDLGGSVWNIQASFHQCTTKIDER